MRASAPPGLFLVYIKNKCPDKYRHSNSQYMILLDLSRAVRNVARKRYATTSANGLRLRHYTTSHDLIFSRELHGK